MHSDSTVEDFIASEKLYRGVHRHQIDGAKIFSSAFKDSQGVSVDRSLSRTEPECIAFLLRKKDFDVIVRVGVSELPKEVKPVHKPIDGNIFHSEIHRSTGEVTLSAGQARLVSSAATICHQKDPE